MNQTVTLLQDIVAGQKMGVEAVDKMLGRITESQLINNLNCQREKYAQKMECAKQRLAALGKPPHQTSAFAQLGLEVGIKLNLKTDDTPSHTAEMMIRGGAMGLIELAQSLNENQKASNEAKILARDCISDEIDNINMWKYLL